MKGIQKIVARLSPEMQQEVLEYSRLLLANQVAPAQTKLRLSWAGALREFREQFTALELQHRGIIWRGR